MPISAPGSRRSRRRACGPCGFTLVELLVVLFIVSLAVSTVALALRDSEADRLQREAERLSLLLESARVEARSSGLAVTWQPLDDDGTRAAGFRFQGLPAALTPPQHWLASGTTARVIGAAVLVLGPEAVIGPQRLELSRNGQRLVLASDGIGPFEPVGGESPAGAAAQQDGPG